MLDCPSIPDSPASSHRSFIARPSSWPRFVKDTTTSSGPARRSPDQPRAPGCAAVLHDRRGRRPRACASTARGSGSTTAHQARIVFDLDRIDPEPGPVQVLPVRVPRPARRPAAPSSSRLRSGSGTWLPKRLDPLGRRTVHRRSRSRQSTQPGQASGSQQPSTPTTWSPCSDRRSSNVVPLTGMPTRRPGRDHRTASGSDLIGRRTVRPEPGDATTAALMARVRSTELRVLRWSDAARRLQQRVRFSTSRSANPGPTGRPHALVDTLDEWLAPSVPRHGTSRPRRLDRVTVLRSQLPWPVGSQLETSRLPNSSCRAADGADRLRRWTAGHVRACAGPVRRGEHPTAGGVPIRLHLLSPADRDPGHR